MKIILKWLLIGWCCGAAAGTMGQEKKYIMLDMLDSLDMQDSLYKVSRYTLKTKELYGVDETIEMYNVQDIGLTLFSVLPDFTSNANWSEVHLADIQAEMFDEESFRDMIRDGTMSASSADKKTMQYSLVKTEDGKYFKSNHCLAEFFYALEHSSKFNTPYGTLNTGQQPISIREMEKVFDQQDEFPFQGSFPLDVRLPWTYLNHWWLVQREYLSKVFEINGEQAYQFWTLTDWRNHDGYNLHRGIDRFIYMPDKGIVGGSYDFYFLFEENWGFIEKGRDRHTKTRDELWQNVLEEKVMLAEELK